MTATPDHTLPRWQVRGIQRFPDAGAQRLVSDSKAVLAGLPERFGTLQAAAPVAAAPLTGNVGGGVAALCAREMRQLMEIRPGTGRQPQRLIAGSYRRKLDQGLAGANSA